MEEEVPGNLTPLESLDLGAVTGFADLLRRMGKAAFGARDLGHAFDVLKTMVADSDCTIVVTLSGAMTVAKMGNVLCAMIDGGMAHLVVSTGALIAHGLSEAIGGSHLKCDRRMSDRTLYESGYHRVYDSLETDANLHSVEMLVSDALGTLDLWNPWCSFQLNHAIGKRLVESGHMPSILGCAYDKGVPVYVPAFTDSELGLAVAAHAFASARVPENEPNIDELVSRVPAFNPYLDLYDFALRLVRARRLGILTIGGGVPRNWGQQIGPFIDAVNERLDAHFPVPRARYGVRICPEPDFWGGLSGATYAEGVSWGKFVPVEDGGLFAEVHCDATIAWPLLILAALESRGMRAEVGAVGG